MVRTLTVSYVLKECSGLCLLQPSPRPSLQPMALTLARATTLVLAQRYIARIIERLAQGHSDGVAVPQLGLAEL